MRHEAFITLQRMEKSTVAQHLMAWYAEHKRPLPWRQDSDPYKIWLSEIILQQTRVAQGLPYYKRFINAYPTVHDLAKASEQDVLHLWQGLGYYSRARRLHQCSRYIVEKLGGTFPDTYEGLLALPGVGPYTAGAIASIAFRKPTPVVDGNVYRVLARLFGIEDDIASPAGQKVFRQLAATLVPAQDPGTYNQALMEFGALHCTPQQPQCARCPLQRGCVAYQTNKQHLLPVKKRRLRIKKRFLYYLLIHFDGLLYVKKRTHKDIWHGLYDFYLIEHPSAVERLDELDDPLMPYVENHALRLHTTTAPLSHQLTHQRLYMHFFHVHATADFLAAADNVLRRAGMQAYPYKDLPTLPFPRAIHRFFEETSLLHTSPAQER